MSSSLYSSPSLTHNLENIPSTSTEELKTLKRFSSSWNLPNLNQGKKRVVKDAMLPLKMDAKGHPLGSTALGSRMRMDKKMVDRL
jgi:hypothetical protein